MGRPPHRHRLPARHRRLLSQAAQAPSLSLFLLREEARDGSCAFCYERCYWIGSAHTLSVQYTTLRYVYGWIDGWWVRVNATNPFSFNSRAHARLCGRGRLRTPFMTPPT